MTVIPARLAFAIRLIRKSQARCSAAGARSVRSIALLLVCLDWKSDSFTYRTQLPFDSKVATLPTKAYGAGPRKRSTKGHPFLPWPFLEIRAVSR